MFLLKVYRYNKWLCIGMLFFMLIQLGCFYKQGMVFSPFFNYGMYSEVIKPQSGYELYKIYADGELLKGTDFSPQQWDAIHFTAIQADAAQCNENFYEKEISRLFSKFHLPVPGKNHYVNPYTPKTIKQHYSEWLANQLSAQTISIVPMQYNWNGYSLTESDSLKAISSSSFQCR